MKIWLQYILVLFHQMKYEGKCEMKSYECNRISRIELFDEFEEWNLLQGHYCILVASQGCIDDIFEELVKMDH